MPYVVPDTLREPLYAVVPYFNPWRSKAREKHTIRALKHFADSGAVVVLVEAAFNRRDFAFADCGLEGARASCDVLGAEHDHRHMRVAVRTRDELWIKENLINLGVARLPHDWQQVCWLDSDVHFMRPNWVGECAHKLQHYGFLQMFSHARDLAPDYEVLPEDYPYSDGASFVRAWETGSLLAASSRHTSTRELSSGRGLIPAPYPGRVWPGLAWAATRWAWDAVGGLIDWAVWGGADWHMSHALIGKLDNMMRPDLHPSYRKLVQQWAHRCRTHVRGNVGTMTGSIVHHWHGRKSDRGYNAKHALLARIGFDPLRHLKRDYQGVWQLHDDGGDAYVQLRDTLRQIAHERDEDSNDTRLDLWSQGH